MMGMVEEFERGIATLRAQGPGVDKFDARVQTALTGLQTQLGDALRDFEPVVDQLVGLGSGLVTLLTQAAEQRRRLEAAHAALSLGRVDEAMNELEAALGTGVVP